eukprot:COSAG05_NODE_597_length_8449_cov_615.285389_11_plen_422_part_00
MPLAYPRGIQVESTELGRNRSFSQGENESHGAGSDAAAARAARNSLLLWRAQLYSLLGLPDASQQLTDLLASAHLRRRSGGGRNGVSPRLRLRQAAAEAQRRAVLVDTVAPTAAAATIRAQTQQQQQEEEHGQQEEEQMQVEQTQEEQQEKQEDKDLDTSTARDGQREEQQQAGDPPSTEAGAATVDATGSRTSTVVGVSKSSSSSDPKAEGDEKTKATTSAAAAAAAATTDQKTVRLDGDQPTLPTDTNNLVPSELLTPLPPPPAAADTMEDSDLNPNIELASARAPAAAAAAAAAAEARVRHLAGSAQHLLSHQKETAPAFRLAARTMSFSQCDRYFYARERKPIRPMPPPVHTHCSTSALTYTSIAQRYQTVHASETPQYPNNHLYCAYQKLSQAISNRIYPTLLLYHSTCMFKMRCL